MPDARPWLLNVPQFTQDLKSVLSAFPDARLVLATRALDAVLASSASLVHSQMSVQSDMADPEWIGREWLRKISLREDRIAEALAASDVPRVMLQYHRVRERRLGGRDEARL